MAGVIANYFLELLEMALNTMETNKNMAADCLYAINLNSNLLCSYFMNQDSLSILKAKVKEIKFDSE